MFNLFKQNEESITEANVVTSGTAKSFKDIRSQWTIHATERKITSQDIAALCIYRSLLKGEGNEGALFRLRKSFRPITNLIKLENGADPNVSLKNALWSVKYSVFKDWLTEEEFRLLLALAQAVRKDIK